MYRIILILLFISVARAEPIGNLVTVIDGLNVESNENISDDYIRLDLHSPSYQTANNINKAVSEWLGPKMVIVQNSGRVLVQAPRDSSSRVAFIAALLQLDVD
ncbi:flagellar basal body P-ring protein FlgI [Reinekea marinisedimentorum]|uniref:Flagellar P-ring protein FlgI n=1 Tax=Reinekea marinisedimentorum TaxID=230495 RepID=A0A4R3HXW4_9GAMM|nr:flagellar basal body P-ring protein FlgI [Reinekea marinisedimentorum]TCS38156.1 flagellar P-ring protein precursor FlgI [Reinekea marinisedimentorum]